MSFTIRQGLDIPLAGVPRQVIENGPDISSVVLTSKDFHGVRPEVLVKLGERIVAGQPLFRDRNRPEIRFVASASGVVADISYSHRRSLDFIAVTCDGTSAACFNSSGDPRVALLESGLWASLKTRPFGHIPDVGARAEAILVTAIDSNPHAPDPVIVLSQAQESFARGLEILTELNQTAVLVCQASGPPLVKSNNELVRCESFSGKHPAGLAGTHLDCLELSGRPVWQIGYQDVISIGHLFLTGHLSCERVVSIAGPMARKPRLLRTRCGANFDDLLDGEMLEGAVRVLSGSVLSGRTSEYLGHFDTQVSVIAAPTRPTRFQFFTQSGATRPAPIIPSEAFEGVLPQNILPVPLMRALSIGDWEVARKLGCLDLLEEDVALLSYLCSSGNDYAALLRQALDDFSEGV